MGQDREERRRGLITEYNRVTQRLASTTGQEERGRQTKQ